MTPYWLTAFIDLTAEHYARGVEYWCDITGYRVSAARGELGEFASLVPDDGDDHLRVQRLADGTDRIHLDLHVEDPRTAAADAVRLGAAEVAEYSRLGYVVMTSPGGFTFCYVPHSAGRRSSAATWPGGHRSVVDQVCLDIPPSAYEDECRFWSDLMGWELRSSGSPEFRHLARPADQPLRILLQRLDDEQPAVTAHLDLATDDRRAETARHVALGGAVQRVHDDFTVLSDPHGSAYCITDRTPPG